MTKSFTALPLVIVISSGSFAENIVSVSQVATEVQSGKTSFLDERFPMEWRPTRIPRGAKVVRVFNAKSGKTFVDKAAEAVDRNKTMLLLLIRVRGSRSSYTRDIVSAAGFNTLQDISEGMLTRSGVRPGRIKQGLPVTELAKC